MANACAWQCDPAGVADLDPADFDGMIELHVWRRSYRVRRWREGVRIDDPRRQFFIKRRE